MWVSDSGLHNVSFNVCTISQISRKIAFNWLVLLHGTFESLSALGINQLRFSVRCPCVLWLLGKFIEIFAPAKASVCKASKYSKQRLNSTSSLVKALWQSSNRLWNAALGTLWIPLGVCTSRYTFSAISHLMAQTFRSLAAQWRTVRPATSTRWGSAPDCSSDWINEFGDLEPKANISGVILLSKGDRSTSAPTWNTRHGISTRIMNAVITVDDISTLNVQGPSYVGLTR